MRIDSWNSVCTSLCGCWIVLCSVHLQTQMLEQLLAYIEEVLEIFNLQQLYTKFSKCKSVRKGLTELCSL